MLLPLGLILFGSFKTSQEFRTTGPLTPPTDWLNFDNYVTAFTRGQHAPGLRQHRVHPRRRDRRHDPDRAATALRARPLPLRRTRHGARAVPARHARPRRHDAGRDVPDHQRARALRHPLRADPALHGHGHRLDLHLPAVHAVDPDVPGRGRDDRGRRAPAGSTARSSCPCSSRPSRPSSSSRASRSTTSSTSRSSTCRPRTCGRSPPRCSGFKGPYGAQWEIISAGAVITIIPTLVLFLFLQRYIYNGFTSGATK